MEDYRTAPLDPAMKQLLYFAEKVAHDPGQATPNDIATLRSEGFSERAILDATHVAGFFSYMNRVVKALGADGGTLIEREKNLPNIVSLSDAPQRL
jgi:alkylhydroperoxidase family enzyme